LAGEKSNAFEEDAQLGALPTPSEPLQNPPKRAIGPLSQLSHVFLPHSQINSQKSGLSLIFNNSKSLLPIFRKNGKAWGCT